MECRSVQKGEEHIQIPVSMASGKASVLDAKRLIEQGPTLTTKGASPKDECLCVVKCLQRYEAVTAEFQPREEAGTLLILR